MRIVLRNAHLLDHTHALTPGSILIEGERIRSLAADAANAAADLTIDLTGCTVLPGYVDTNLPAFPGEDMEKRIRERLQAGVTTVCISPPLHEDSSVSTLPVPPAIPETLHLHSILYDAKDADFQTMVEQGHMHACRRVIVSGKAAGQLDPVQLRRLCALGSRCGLNIAANAQNAAVLKKLIACGITELLEVPLFSLTDDLLMQMLAHGVGLSISSGCIADYADETSANLLRFLHAGGLLAICSGYAGTLKPTEQLRYLTALGLSLTESIRIMTLNGALLMGSAMDEGSLLTGKYANLTVIEGIPTEDLSPFAKIRMVMLKGKLI